jgi:hypothetical protein
VRVRVRVRARVRVRVGVRARSHLNLVVSLRRGTDVSEPADVGTDLRLLPIGHGHVHLRRTLLLNGRTRGRNSAVLEATALGTRGKGWAPNRRGRPVPGTAGPARATLRRHGTRGRGRGALWPCCPTLLAPATSNQVSSTWTAQCVAKGQIPLTVARPSRTGRVTTAAAAAVSRVAWDE